eukprot:CAMPEP_0194579534 /NCGR_PEP_ID=MMETSP0292-20121207/13572_1 /TAXON_ID=39354 /ORGANISM="Heterosigma akashiwo, Strain CCMP2393" /LENGTH=155 /DNA_ID=CAMNT_0039432525 /DNA_START=451 /DNA_END=915 /DNA_ORIENTATION=+
MVLLPEVPCTFITPQHSLHHIFPQLLVQSPAPFPVRAVDGAVVVQAIKDEVVHVDPDVPPPVGRVARRVLAAVEEVALGEGADPVGGPQLVFVPQEGEQAAEPRVPGAQQAQRQGQDRGVPRVPHVPVLRVRSRGVLLSGQKTTFAIPQRESYVW